MEEFTLRDYITILVRRKWLLILPLLVFPPIVYLVDIQRPPIYMAYATFESQQPRVAVGDELERSGATISQRPSFYTLVYMVKSRPFLEKALRIYQQRIRKRYSPSEIAMYGLDVKDVDTLASGLAVQVVNGTDLFRLVARDTNPLRCAERVNILMEALKEYSRETATKNLKEVHDILKRQLQKISSDFSALENEIKTYKKKARLLNVASEQHKISSQIQRLNAALTAVDLKIEELKAKLADTRRHDTAEDQRRRLSSNPRYTALVGSLTKLETELSNLTSQYTLHHPAVIAKQREIERVRERLDELKEELLSSGGAGGDEEERRRLKQELSLLEKKKRKLLASLKEAEEKLAHLPSIEQKLADLERKKKILEDLYVDTSKKFREIQIAIISRESDIRILEPASVPTSPVSPKISRDLMYTIWACLALGIILIIVVENVVQPLNTPEQMEKLLGIKNIGNIYRITPSSYEIPQEYEEYDPHLVALHSPASLLNDPFRKIRTNLLSLGYGETLHTILITSSVPEEGKSLTVANLGVNFANIGKRTLIVDADLRTPSQGDIFARPNTPGLVQLLGGNSPVDEYTRSTGIENLHLLPAGEKGQMYIEALCSPRLEQVLVELRSKYDIVLVDPPPVSMVADSVVLAPMVDGVILLVSLGMVSMPTVQQTINLLLNVDAHIIGAVANMYNAGTGHYYGYGYGYYGYDYDYAHRKRE